MGFRAAGPVPLPLPWLLLGPELLPETWASSAASRAKGRLQGDILHKILCQFFVYRILMWDLRAQGQYHFVFQGRFKGQGCFERPGPVPLPGLRPPPGRYFV